MPPPKSSFTLITLSNKVTASESAVEFLRSHQVLNSSSTCKKCGTLNSKVVRKKNTSYYYFPCDNKNCNSMTSIRDGTLLSRANIGIRTFILLAYTFIMFQGLTIAQRIHEADLDDGDYGDLVVPEDGLPHLSTVTVGDYMAVFRDMIGDFIVNQSAGMVGGPGTTCEIDESMFGKRKYNRGRISHRRQCWVLGGVVRETGEVWLALCPNNRRNAETLLPLIQQHVKPGTHIISDCWPAYNTLDQLGYTHSTVNHSKHYKDPVTGAHTNSIEGRWFTVKRSLPRSGAYDLQSYLTEYLWREKVRREGGDHFTSFLKIVAEYQKKEDDDEELPEFYEDMTAPIHDCLYCGKKMTNGEDCRKHVQSECDDRPVWDYPCMYCGLQFPTELGLIIHTARWCKEKPTK